MAVAGEDRYTNKPSKGPESHPAEALGYMLMGGGEYRQLTLPVTKPLVAAQPIMAVTDFDPFNV